MWRFLALAPGYGGSLELRAPFALLPGAVGRPRGRRLPGRLDPLPARRGAARRLARRRAARALGHSLLARAVALGLCVANPVTLYALQHGHAEELLGAVLCVARRARRPARPRGLGGRPARARDRQQAVGARRGRPGAARAAGGAPARGVGRRGRGSLLLRAAAVRRTSSPATASAAPARSRRPAAARSSSPGSCGGSSARTASSCADTFGVVKVGYRTPPGWIESIAHPLIVALAVPATLLAARLPAPRSAAAAGLPAGAALRARHLGHGLLPAAVPARAARLGGAALRAARRCSRYARASSSGWSSSSLPSASRPTRRRRSSRSSPCRRSSRSAPPCTPRDGCARRRCAARSRAGRGDADTNRVSGADSRCALQRPRAPRDARSGRWSHSARRRAAVGLALARPLRTTTAAEAAGADRRAAARPSRDLLRDGALLRRLARCCARRSRCRQPRGRRQLLSLPPRRAAVPARARARSACGSRASCAAAAARVLAAALAVALCAANPIAYKRARARPPRGAARRRAVRRRRAARACAGAHGLGRARARPRDRQQAVGAARDRAGAARPARAAAGARCSSPARSRPRSRRRSSSPSAERRGRDEPAGRQRHRRRSSTRGSSSGSSGTPIHWGGAVTADDPARLAQRPRLARRARAPADRLARRCR